jgi:hypothetical protein
MNKFFGYLAVFFLIPMQLLADTDSKTVDFLNKVNGYYYSLSRDGFKGFQCRVTLTLSDPLINIAKTKYQLDENMIRALQNIEFAVSCDPENPSPVTLVSPEPSGDVKNWIHFEEVFRNGLQDFMKNWEWLVVGPVFGPKQFAEPLLVQNKADGFEVSLDKKITNLVFDFDQKAKLRSFTANKTKLGDKFITGIKGTSLLSSLKPEFISDSKGFVLGGYFYTGGYGINEEYENNRFKINYEIMNRFWLPQKVNWESQCFQKKFNDSFTMTFNFTDYKINQ